MPRAGADGMRCVLFLCNPEPLQYPLISIDSLPYLRVRPALDPPAPFLEIDPFIGNIAVCDDTATGWWLGNIGTCVTPGDVTS